jgi:hypothetical protein
MPATRTGIHEEPLWLTRQDQPGLEDWRQG